MVSAVPPDLEITSTRARFRFTRSSSAPMDTGSTLSITCRRGQPPRASRSSSFQRGGQSALRSMFGPSAEPPMPQSTTSSISSRDASASTFSATRTAASSGSSGKPSVPAARRAFTSATAPANAAAAVASESAGRPPWHAGLSMLVKSKRTDMRSGNAEMNQRNRGDGCTAQRHGQVFDLAPIIRHAPSARRTQARSPQAAPPRDRRGSSRASGA